MKTHNYTKTVLTIIAVCLVMITFQNVDIIPKAYASENKTIPSVLPSSNYGLIPVNEDGSINVNIKSAEEIEVDLVKIDGYWVKQSGGRLQVEVDN